jgi:hypothetical protein
MKLYGIVVLLVGLVFMADGCSRRSKTSTTDAEIDAKVTPATGTGAHSRKAGLGSFTIGKKTTFVTSPVETGGHIDYAAALNERLSKGVTIENNAAVLLWKVIGPHPEKATMPPRFYELLGVQIPEQGDYFVPLRQYLETQGKANPATITATLEKMTKLGQQTWTTNEHPEMNAWLKANDKPMTLLLEATKRTHYFSPMLPPRDEKGSTGLIKTLLPGVQISRQLGSALADRAMLYLGHGQVDAAWQDLLACHRLGRLVGRGGTLIEGLVGIAIEQLACRGELVFLDKVQPDAKRIEACTNDLRALVPPVNPADKVDLCERFTGLDNIMMLDKQGLAYLTSFQGGGNAPNPLGNLALDGIDWDPTLETMNRWYDKMATVMREKDRGERVRKMEQFTVDIQTLKKNATDPARLAEILGDGKATAKARGQAVGNILVSLLFPAANKVQDASDRIAQTFDNVQVAFALAGYQRENGKYPDRLELLAPKYLAQAPKDSFTGNALIYRPAGNGYLLYSVGLNGKDDGGRGPDDQPPGDDLVVRMPMPVPH